MINTALYKPNFLWFYVKTNNNLIFCFISPMQYKAVRTPPHLNQSTAIKNGSYLQ